ncbi:MAG: sulfate adenylyltransferase, partial [Gammaproteobacteria bacterium]|nr:sulfate adenylyltransferase [Gammaproteobacteria bacterium]
DILVDVQSSPEVEKEIVADVCWMDEQPLQPRGKYLIKHGTQTIKVIIGELQHRIDVNSSEQDDTAETLNVNEIGRVSLRTQKPLAFDDYDEIRATGSFIVIDEFSNNTVAAGMIRH